MPRAHEEAGLVFEVTERGDVFVRARVYDWLCTLGGLSRVYQRALRLAGDDVPPRRILDIGTGTGAMALALKAAIPGAEVHGVDPSDAMLDVAMTNGARAGDVVHFRPGWAQSLPFAGAEFDLVTIAAVLHHIPAEQHGVVAAEVRRVLGPAGRVLIVEVVPVGPLAAIAPDHGCGIDLERCGRVLADTGFGDIRFGRVTRALFGYVTGRLPAERHGAT